MTKQIKQIIAFFMRAKDKLNLIKLRELNRFGYEVY